MTTNDGSRTVDTFERGSGKHPGYRRSQARGVFMDGTFTPSGAAAELTTAAHLQRDSVPVTVRFSSADGDPKVPDTARVSRGMTVRFRLPDETHTDLVTVSMPTFIAHTPESFFEAVEAVEAMRADPAPLRAYITKYPRTAIAFAALNAQPPASYANLRYWAIHAFVWRNRAGQAQSVRYRWEPDAGVALQEQLDDLPADYLTREILSRPSTGFTLRVQLAASGDTTDDATLAWPADRPQIDVGHLRLTRPAAEQDVLDAQGYAPTNLTAGIELSDDPLLPFRQSAYAESHRRRSEEAREGIDDVN